MLGLILYVLMFSMVSLAMTETLEVMDGPDAANTQARVCRDGWISYQTNTQLYCITAVQQAKSFEDAQSRCQSMGGFLATADDTDVDSLLQTISTYDVSKRAHWIGLRKVAHQDGRFFWQKRDRKIYAPHYIAYDVRSYSDDYSSEHCVSVIQESQMTMETGHCSDSKFFICQREASCKPGYFGKDCEQQCHCEREPCESELLYSPSGLFCKFGCQENFTGAACDKENQNIDVKYYCINSAGRGGTYVDIRIYTTGMYFSTIYGLTSYKVRGDWCESTVIDRRSWDLSTIRIPVNNVTVAQMSSGKCAGQQLGEDTFSWAIVLKEVDGLLDELDIKVNVTCDFSVADNLARSGEFSTGGEENQIQEISIIPESTHDDVLLRVIKATSGEPISEAAIGTGVGLEMEHALLQGSLLKGIQPYNCVTSSSDGKHVKQLLDENGCRVRGSPIKSFFSTGEKNIKTPYFKLFAFEGDTSVNFRCSFDLCFTSDCTVGCRQQERRRRDTQDVKEEQAHTTTRTIRVLPSISVKGNRQTQGYQPATPPAAPAAYDMGPFVYVNPVTCSLFLLILLVFLCMYIAFIRTLRKSVYDIRKEIEVKRSQDKFLNCGCLQQKDRDYVAP